MQAYQVVTSTTPNSYTIELSTSACQTLITGGNQITTSLVTKLVKGDQDPNSYTIKLNKALTNVVMVRMVSSEFPNSEKVVQAYPPANQNNKIYWQNQDDGEYLYSIEVDAGNYAPADLIDILQQKFYNTPRINYNYDVTSTNGSTPPYTNHNYIRVDINTSTDIVTFNNYREVFLIEPFIEITPSISPDPTVDALNPNVLYVITVYHKNHGLSAGNVILISGAISPMGIPTTVLNNAFSIYSVIDYNRYTIQLPMCNLLSVRDDNKGGLNVAIYSPNIFRLRFDFSDTMGPMLGFRNCGDAASITVYTASITNIDPYDMEINIDEFGNTKIYQNNALNFNGNNYILMECDQISTLSHTGGIKDVFAKILLTDTPGKYIFNSYVSTPAIFYKPIPQVSDLTFNFYSQNYVLYNFYGLNHSFTLEFTTLTDTPQNTNISSRTGKIS